MTTVQILGVALVLGFIAITANLWILHNKVDDLKKEVAKLKSKTKDLVAEDEINDPNIS